MECAYHPNREPVGTCHECGRFVCMECRNLFNGNIFCPPCSDKLFLKQDIQIPVPPVPADLQPKAETTTDTPVFSTIKPESPAAEENITAAPTAASQIPSAPLPAQKEAQTPAEASTVSISRISCPSCNNRIEPDDVFCAFCGYELNKTPTTVEVKPEPGKPQPDLLQKAPPLPVITATKVGAAASPPPLTQNMLKPNFSAGGLLKPRTNLIAIISCIFLFVSLFLIWIAPAARLGENITSSSGMDISPLAGIAGILLCLVIIAAAVFLKDKLNSLVQIAAGNLALLILLLIMFFGRLPLFSAVVKPLIIIREGFYIYIIASILIIAGGIYGYLKGR